MIEMIHENIYANVRIIMRLRNVKGSREQIAENEYVIKNAEENRIGGDKK